MPQRSSRYQLRFMKTSSMLFYVLTFITSTIIWYSILFRAISITGQCLSRPLDPRKVFFLNSKLSYKNTMHAVSMLQKSMLTTNSIKFDTIFFPFVFTSLVPMNMYLKSSNPCKPRSTKIGVLAMRCLIGVFPR